MELRRDSITALMWAGTERARGTIVINDAMIWTLLYVAAEVEVHETTHIRGVDNESCDRLSRRHANENLSVVEHAGDLGFNGVIDLRLQSDSNIQALLLMCDFSVDVSSDENFRGFGVETQR